MPKIENTVVIDRPAEMIWKFYTELSNIPTLDPYIHEAKQTPPGPLGLGSTFSLKGEDWTLLLRVTQFEPNRKLAYECISPDSLKGSTDSYILEPYEGKTRFVETMDVKSSGFYRLAGSFFGKRAKEDSGTRLNNLKRKLESENSQTHV
jgi:uncharacterized membrane protein